MEQLITIITRHQSHYERLKTHEVNRFNAFLRRMDKELRDALANEDITEYNRARLQKKLNQIESMLKGTYKDFRVLWYQSIVDAAEYEAGFERRTLKHILDDVEFSMPSIDQIKSAVFMTPLGDIKGPAGGSLLAPLFEDMARASIKRVQNAIRLGYAQGETTPQIVRRIRGTKAAGYRDGVLAIAKRNADIITRTSLQHASMQARAAVWKKNRSVIARRKIVATLDDRTSTICRSLDGQLYPLDSGPHPPFHLNCRTTETVVLAGKYAALSEVRTRAARDPKTGKVAPVKDQTYYDWLKKQPAKVQDSIIGPTRGKLLRNGGISSERFAELQLGKNFEPLTLDEMRDLEPTAFDKANL